MTQGMGGATQEEMVSTSDSWNNPGQYQLKVFFCTQSKVYRSRMWISEWCASCGFHLLWKYRKKLPACHYIVFLSAIILGCFFCLFLLWQVILLECLPKESTIPTDIFSHFNTAFAYAKEGLWGFEVIRDFLFPFMELIGCFVLVNPLRPKDIVTLILPICH